MGIGTGEKGEGGEKSKEEPTASKVRGGVGGQGKDKEEPRQREDKEEPTASMGPVYTHMYMSCSVR